ncbi:aminoacylase-1-like [Plodia interpunctella]|uniref:aminoacylase-1-like n=1 Tax=Plodia interpunctella TaxID=58824 RepID=UPI002368095A|nr:aminoacylase-1-like [Plodia interpunctella]
MCTKWMDDPEIQRFREYLKIPSVHPDIDYDDCVAFLMKQALELDLPIAVYEVVPSKPVVVITWAGTEPNLPSILLNSHMDVVPIYEEHWTHPPFAATLTEDGFIFARGTQDMKGIGMMHLEAVRRLKSAAVRLKRTVHISFVPDEEIGGVVGMKSFTETEDFKSLNVGFCLDESMPCDDNAIYAFNGERTNREIKVTCRGTPMHGAELLPGTAGEKLHFIIDKFMKFREEERKKVAAGTPLGEVTTVNLTQVEGGVQINVIPENLSVSFDIRVAPERDHDEFEEMITRWCKEAGEGVTFEYFVKNPLVKSTRTDESVPFWAALKETVEHMGIELRCIICPGATDARYVRRRGIPAIGFSPISSTPMLLHAHDERIHVKVFKRGIDVMEKTVLAVANV